MSDMRAYDVDECTGKGGYPPQWHETVKHAVREAAGNRCVRCFHPYVKGAGEWSPCDDLCAHAGPKRCRLSDEQGNVHPEWSYSDGTYVPNPINAHDVQARWRILTVHHLDGDKANCRWWNLVALCQRCHLTIQGRVRMERTWPWEHSEWFKPYVAGYYAWTYLGEDITREDAVARLDELLSLERAA